MIDLSWKEDRRGEISRNMSVPKHKGKGLLPDAGMTSLESREGCFFLMETYDHYLITNEIQILRIRKMFKLH